MSSKEKLITFHKTMSSISNTLKDISDNISKVIDKNTTALVINNQPFKKEQLETLKKSVDGQKTILDRDILIPLQQEITGFNGEVS